MRLTKDIEFLDNRVRIWTDEGMQEVFCTREEFAAHIDRKAAEVTPEHVLALHLREHKKTDPNFERLEQLKNRDFDVAVNERAKVSR